MCTKAKEKWLEKQCTVIEQDSKSYVRSVYVYKNVQELTKDISLTSQTVQESNQKIGSSSLSKLKFYLGGQNTKKN